jgi:carboxyl-terminal processing protease
LEKGRFAERLWHGLALVFTLLFLAPLTAAPDLKDDALRREALQAEKARQWDKACILFDQLIAKHRNAPELRDHFRSCLRLAHIVHRHHEQSYRDGVLGRDIRSAFKIYREVVTKLRANYVEPDKTDLTRLFQSGLDELLMAIDEEVFQQEHMRRDLGPLQILAFRVQLRDRWGRAVIRNQRDLETEVGKVAQAVRQGLQVEPVVTVFEFACGACNCLDENTLFLTPSQLNEVYASLEGEVVGVGIDVVVRDQKVIVSQILMGSPASLEGLKAEDRIARIDKKPVDGLPEEMVNERLRGVVGTIVELDVVPAGEGAVRSVALTRQVFRIPSVVQVQVIPEQEDIGFCRVVSFQTSTPHELDEALIQLKMQGMKALIVDLRGNWGGVFTSAVQAAERFLPEGKVIVSTQSPVPEQVQVHRAAFPGALDIPLVVLIDGETASAAEVLAGALKDHGRAVLVGQPTFGKCSIQRVLQLDASGTENARSGMRVTLAKFLSPGGTSYNLKGVTPDIVVERPFPVSMSDDQLSAAIRVARAKLTMMRQ